MVGVSGSGAVEERLVCAIFDSKADESTSNVHNIVVRGHSGLQVKQKTC